MSQAAAPALINSPATGDASAISKENESTTSSNPTTVVVSCRAPARSLNGLRLITKPMPSEMKMSAVPIHKQALDAVLNDSQAARGWEPERTVYAIPSGGSARIRRWINTGDRRIDRRVGPGPWLTMTSGVDSLEDVEAVSHAHEGQTKPPRAQVPDRQDQDRS